MSTNNTNTKKTTNNLSNELFETSMNKVLDMLKSLQTSITTLDEKLDMTIKRQNDIEDKVLFRLEKKTAEETKSSLSSSNDSNDGTRTITLKEKIISPVKKTRKKNTTDTPQVFKRGNIVMKVYNDSILLTGETFDRKELIKSFNGKWDATNKGWAVPRDKADKLKFELEKYSESLDYDEIDEYLVEPKKIENKPKLNDKTFNTCQIMDDDDE
jgi:hypothetical protein